MASTTSKKRDALKFFLDSLTGPGGKGKVGKVAYDYHSRIAPEAAGEVVELATRLIGFLDETLARP